ncbi:MAG: PIN domain-containing protein [Nanoarchaeota archaeon]
MRRIILDTNFLMVPLQFKVDIFSEIHRICNFQYKIFIFEQSIDELNAIIKEQKGKDKKAAQFALKIVKSKDIEILKAEGDYVDNIIIQNRKDDDIVATTDLDLKKKLLERYIAVIVLRQKKYLQIFERKLYK